MIADVRLNKSWQEVYDEKGKRIKDFSVAVFGEYCGHSECFIVFLKGMSAMA